MKDCVTEKLMMELQPFKNQLDTLQESKLYPQNEKKKMETKAECSMTEDMINQ